MALFDEVTNEIPENPLETLVGEGKKYSDVNELAKAKLHADRAIAERERELAELREDLNKRLTAEQLLEEIRQNKQSANSQAAVTPPPVTNANEKTAQVDLQAEIRKVMEEQNRTSQTQSNLSVVADKLVEVFGSEDTANRIITQKAKELGVSTQFLQSVAAQSPKAFFAQIGLTPEQTRATSTPTTPRPEVSVNVNLNSGPKPGTYAYFEHMRQTDPKTYFSPKTQIQMANLALEKGDAFYA